jgi:uncharacterized membrane protein YgcG
MYMQMDLTTTDVPDAMDGFEDAPEQAAEIFARYIHDVWGVGGADDGTTGVLIFLSIEDRTVYFSRGRALERVLRDTRVDAVIETMKPFLRQKKYDQAILTAITELDIYLAAGPGLDWEEWFANWFGTIVVFSMFGGFGLCIYKDILDRRHYARVSTHLNDLDRARAEALQGTFKCTSCPICLENFKKKACTVIHEHVGEEAETAAASSEESTPLVDSENDPTTDGGESSSTDDELVGSDGLALRLLRCGHTFDETCWQEWISSGNSHSIHRCPICQQDVGEEQPDSSTTSPLTVDPLSIPRGGQNDNDDNGETMVRQQDAQINTTTITNYNAEHENGDSTDEIRRQLRSLAMRQYTTERNFRLLRLAARFPQYIQRNELQRWTQVSYNGSLAQEAQLARQAAIERSTSSSSSSSWGNTSSGFGGGFSSGGRGGRW